MACPTLPIPTTPTVRPLNPIPYRLGRHASNAPLLINRSPAITCRAIPISRPTASSAVGIVKRSSTIVIQTPRRVHASTSKLSYPLRAQATIFKSGQSARNASFTLSGIKAIIAEASRHRWRTSSAGQLASPSFRRSSVQPWSIATVSGNTRCVITVIGLSDILGILRSRSDQL